MTKRIDWIDSYKGIGICCVVLYHTQTLPEPISVFIASFFMPMFFFASGLTFKLKENVTFCSFLKKRTVTLFFPYLLYLLCSIGVDLIKHFLTGASFSAVNCLIGILIGIRGYYDAAGRGWFIYCFFVVELLMFALVRLSKNNSKKIAAGLCILFVAGYLYTRWLHDDFPLPWRFEDALVNLFFTGFAYLLREKIFKMKYKGFWFLIPAVFFALLNFRLSKAPVASSGSFYGELLPMVISAVCGCLFFVSVAQLLNTKYAQFLGRNTLFIYLFHFFLWIYPLPNLLLQNRISTESALYNPIYTLLMFAETLLVFSLLIPIYNRITQPIIQKMTGRQCN